MCYETTLGGLIRPPRKAPNGSDTHTDRHRDTGKHTHRKRDTHTHCCIDTRRHTDTQTVVTSVAATNKYVCEKANMRNT